MIARVPEPRTILERMRGLRNEYSAGPVADYSLGESSRFRRTRRGLPAGGAGHDYHTRNETRYLRMMEIARDIDRRDPVIKQGVNRLVSNVVQTGFSLDVSTGSDAADVLLRDLWRRWSTDRRECDFHRTKTFFDMERLVCRSPVIDGDIFGLPMATANLQMAEAHRCRTPSNTRRNVVNGVIKNAAGQLMGYMFTKTDWSPLQQLQRVSDIREVDAFDKQTGKPQVFHALDTTRATQSRGVTALAQIADPVEMHADIQFAKLVQQQMASCYAILHEYEVNEPGAPAPGLPNTGESVDNAEHTDGTSRTQEGISPGLEYFGAPGEKLSGFSPRVPNPEFFDHVFLVLSIIAANLDLPVQVLLLDPRHTNFSGWRGAMDQARQRYREIQQRLIQQWHTPVYRWKVDQWASTIPELAEFVGNPTVDLYGHRWNPPRWPYVEPLKDAAANKMRVDERQTSPRRMCQELGQDHQEIVAETVADNGLLIRSAITEADAINREFPKLARPIEWTDVLVPPTGTNTRFSATVAESIMSESEETSEGSRNG